MCKNNFAPYGAILCAKLQFLRIRAGSTSRPTEPAHRPTVLLSVGNNDEDCHRLVPIHEQDGDMLRVSFVLKDGVYPPPVPSFSLHAWLLRQLQQPVACEFTFLLPAATAWKTPVQSYFGWYTLEIAVKTISVYTQKYKSSTHTLYAHLCGHMKTFVALTHAHTCTDTWRLQYHYERDPGLAQRWRRLFRVEPTSRSTSRRLFNSPSRIVLGWRAQPIRRTNLQRRLLEPALAGRL